jgi:hypothetical protein
MGGIRPSHIRPRTFKNGTAFNAQRGSTALPAPHDISNNATEHRTR